MMKSPTKSKSSSSSSHQEPIAILELVHHRGVKSVTYSNSGDLFASVSLDCVVAIWSTHTLNRSGFPFRTHHEVSIDCVCFSFDDTILATCGHDSRIILYDVSNSQKICCIGAPRANIINSTINQEIVPITTQDVPGHESYVVSVCFSKTTKPADLVLFSCSWHGDIRVWSLKDLKKPVCVKQIVDAHKGLYVTNLCRNFAGTMLASCGSDRAINLYNLQQQPQTKNKYVIKDMNINKNNDNDSDSDENVNVPISVQHIQQVISFGRDDFTNWVLSVSWSRNDRYIFATSDDTSVRMFDTTNGVRVAVFRGSRSPVYCVVPSASDHSGHVIAGSGDGFVRTYCIDPRKNKNIFFPDYSSNNNNFKKQSLEVPLASEPLNTNSYQKVDYSMQRNSAYSSSLREKESKGQYCPVYSLAVHPNSRYLLVASDNTDIFVYISPERELLWKKRKIIVLLRHFEGPKFHFAFESFRICFLVAQHII